MAPRPGGVAKARVPLAPPVPIPADPARVPLAPPVRHPRRSHGCTRPAAQRNRGDKPRGSPPLRNRPAPPPAASSRPPHYWTWRLLSTGFTVEECAAARGLSPEAVLDHALRAVEEGWRVEARWCLTPELLAAVAAVVGEEQPQQIRPLLAKLPPGTSYQQVEIFLKCRRAQRLSNREDME